MDDWDEFLAAVGLDQGPEIGSLVDPDDSQMRSQITGELLDP